VVSPFEAAANPPRSTPFYRTRRFAQVFFCAALVASTMILAPVDRVSATPIGDDLTESLEGWYMVEEEGSAGSWSHFDAEGSLFAPLSDLPVLSATEGSSYFLKDQSMPSAGVLYRGIHVPLGEDPILLGFDYFVQTGPELSIGETLSYTEYPNQLFMVDILEEVPVDWFSASAALVHVIPPTVGAGVMPATEWISVTLDLTEELGSSRGETVYLAFREVDNLGHLTVGIDNVQFSDESLGAAFCDGTEDESEAETHARLFACAIVSDATTVESAEVVIAPSGPDSFGLATRELLAFPRNGATYGVMSTGNIDALSGTDQGLAEGEPTTSKLDGDEPRNSFGGYGTLWDTVLQGGSSEGSGWRAFDPSDPEPERLTGEPFALPDVPVGEEDPPTGDACVAAEPCFSEYMLFESGDSGVESSSGVYFIDFTVPDLNDEANPGSISFRYFVSSQGDPELSDPNPLFSLSEENNQQFMVEIADRSAPDPDTGDPQEWFTVDRTSVLTRHEELFEGATTEGDDGIAVWQYAEIDLATVFAPGPMPEAGDDLRLAFRAVSNTGPLQIGVGGLNYNVDTSDYSWSVSRLSPQIYDATIIKIDLAPPEGAVCMSVDLRFLSEEFPEYVGGTYNDAFLLELDPFQPEDSDNTHIPTWSIGDNPDTEYNETSWITAPDNFAFAPIGDGVGVLSINTTGEGWFGASYAVDTVFDGGSTLLRATKAIDAGDPNNLYLTIFDQGDNEYDSLAMIDAINFWPNTDCSGEFTIDPSPDPSASPSDGLFAVAPMAEWSMVSEGTEFTTNDAIELTLTFDQPVHDLEIADLQNALEEGDAAECNVDLSPVAPILGDAIIPDGSAFDYSVTFEDCSTGVLWPQLESMTVQGPASNVGPTFSVSGFALTIISAGGGGSGGGGGTPTPSASASSSPSASPSASVTPTPSASVKPTTAPTYSASPIASGGASPSPAPSVKPSPTPSGSSSQSGGGGSSGGDSDGGWTLPKLPTIDELANNFWFGVLLGAILVLAIWGLTNGLQRRTVSAPDEV
jgi:hypothetical protein